MIKEEQRSKFVAILAGYRTIFDDFGVTEFATYDYELQLMDDNWAVVNKWGPGGQQELHHSIPDDMPEGTYSSEVRGIYRKEHFTLIFTPSGMGGAGFAHIFDNDKEVKDLASRSEPE